MSDFKDMELNKKDEKKINFVMKSFKKGLITGIGIFATTMLILIIIEVVKWLKQF